MKRCGACREWILWGGTEFRGKRYCKDECLEWGRSQNYADDIPEKIVRKWANWLRNAPCPICEGPGPNDVQPSQRLIGMVLVAEATDTTVFGCRSCGCNANLKSTIATVVAGWWWLPWGPLAAPFAIVTNFISMCYPIPKEPSPSLIELARHDLGERRRMNLEAPQRVVSERETAVFQPQTRLHNQTHDAMDEEILVAEIVAD